MASGVICDSSCDVLDVDSRPIERVVAASDVARWHNPLFGTDIRVEHWDNAITQGRAAGLRLLGRAVTCASSLLLDGKGTTAGCNSWAWRGPAAR